MKEGTLAATTLGYSPTLFARSVSLEVVVWWLAWKLIVPWRDIKLDQSENNKKVPDEPMGLMAFDERGTNTIQPRC